MGIFSFLFGKKEELQLEDADLGKLNSYHVKGDNIGWMGNVNLWGNEVNVLISGDRQQVDASEKTALLGVLNNAPDTEKLANEALAELYDNADMKYNKWQDHFDIASISLQGKEAVISFEQHDTYYSFNVIIAEGKCIGTSIDS